MLPKHFTSNRVILAILFDGIDENCISGLCDQLFRSLMC